MTPANRQFNAGLRSSPTKYFRRPLNYYGAEGGSEPEYELAEVNFLNDVSKDTVFEQAHFTYDAAGNQIFLESAQRFHNTIGVGRLNGPLEEEPKSRRSYVAFNPDAIGRPCVTANFGTSGGSVLERPATIPIASDMILVSKVRYNEIGGQASSVDPLGAYVDTNAVTVANKITSDEMFIKYLETFPDPATIWLNGCNWGRTETSVGLEIAKALAKRIKCKVEVKASKFFYCQAPNLDGKDTMRFEKAKKMSSHLLIQHLKPTRNYMSHPIFAKFKITTPFVVICLSTSQCNKKSDQAAESQVQLDVSEDILFPEEKMLFSAAIKGDPVSCYRLAARTWSENLDFSKFGTTKEKAKIWLLEKALISEPDATIPLAYIYRYSDENKDLVKARELLKKSAMMRESTSCFDYADMCYTGEGGGQNLEDAYYFASASCLTCDPRSFTGQEGWKLRDNAAALINREKLREISKHLYEWIDTGGSPKLMPGTLPDPKEEYEAAQLIKTMDAAHKAKFKISD